ncbi:MAG: DUF3052 domain-containing protein [Thermoplasmata archaeon]
MPGYSGTPLSKKLGARAGARAYLIRVPAEVEHELNVALAPGLRPGGRGPVDFAMIFARSPRQLGADLSRVGPRLAPAGMVWLCWPKKSSGVEIDFDEHGVRGAGLGAGFVDVKVCAVTETWSGLKFVRRRKDRA